jgi:hypothetical protein
VSQPSSHRRSTWAFNCHSYCRGSFSMAAWISVNVLTCAIYRVSGRGSTLVRDPGTDPDGKEPTAPSQTVGRKNLL